MGIVNVTPDSFSDGGRFFLPNAAVAHAEQLLDDGADIIDLGAESTRPGAQPVPADEEIRRLIPVIQALRERHVNVRISVDTTKSVVVRAALDAGATIVNDVSGLRLDPSIANVCADAGATIVLMHSRGSVAEMASYVHAEYDGDVTRVVVQELMQSVDRARRAGIPSDKIVLDPGIGFSKRSADSLQLLHDLPMLVQQGFPVLVGASRKRMIGELIDEPTPEARDVASVGAHVAALALGARWFRVHNVHAHRQALDVAHTILRSSQTVSSSADQGALAGAQA